MVNPIANLPDRSNLKTGDILTQQFTQGVKDTFDAWTSTLSGSGASMLGIDTTTLAGSGDSIQQYLEYLRNLVGTGGVAWGVSLTGDTATSGLTLTVADSSTSGNAQEIIIGNTQSNVITGLKVNTGTSTVDHLAAHFTGTRFSVQIDNSDQAPGTTTNKLYAVGGTLYWNSNDLTATGAFSTTANVTSNAPGTYATDDFVFGSPQLDDDGDTNHDFRMLFDKSKGAFRAGQITTTDWDDAQRGENSWAGGYNCKASGARSFSFGIGNISSQNNTVTFGSSTDATGAQGFAIGSSTLASGTNSFAQGSGSTASSTQSSAFGSSTVASGDTSFAIGNQSVASAGFSFAGGYITTTSGLYSMSFGRQFRNAQKTSFAIGYGTGISDDTGAAVRLEADADQDDSKKASIYIRQNIAPTTTTDRLYNVGGTLYWNAKNLTVGAFSTTANVTSNAPGTIATDDFVFGSTQLDDSGSNDYRFFYDKSKGAFRAGRATSTQWDDGNRGDYSTAFGTSCTASGNQSFASGSSCTASGASSSAFGTSCLASESGAFATGSNVDANGRFMFATGINYKESQWYCIAVGYGSSVTDTTGTAVRLEADSDGDTSKKPAIYIRQGTAPSTTTNRLYNVGGAIYWNGTDLTAGGLAWNDSISGNTSTTGLTLTAAASSTSGIIESIIMDNAQTNVITGLNIDTGTSVIDHIAALFTGTRFSIQIDDADQAPSVTSNKLYALAGDLYWNGTSVTVSASGEINWGDSISGTSGTGFATTINASASASTIGQSIVADNTQTQGLILLNLDIGTSAPANPHITMRINSNLTPSVVGGSRDLQIRGYTAATQALVAGSGISIGGNFNTNSAFNFNLIDIDVEANVGAGLNTGISLSNSNTSLSSGNGAGLNMFQSGVDGTMISLRTGNNVNASTNGLVNFTLAPTQSGATVIQKIELGGSAQAHIGQYIDMTNANTGIRGTKYNLTSSGTGTAIEISGSNATARVFEIDTNLTQAGGTATGTTTKEIKITISGVDYIIETKSQA